MDVFKLEQGDQNFFPIEKNRFERVTRCKPPYYQIGTDGKVRHYAVCPACDNPTQIIGLIEKKPFKIQPYAKHFHKPIIDKGEELGRFSEIRYQWCPYSRKAKKELSKADKVPMSEISLEIIDHIRNNFDRIIYFIGRMLGISIPAHQAENMLRGYIGEEGYLYAGATLMNVPWIVAYMATAQTLLDVCISNPESPLAKALADNVGEARLNDKHFLKRQPNTLYIMLTHCLLEHSRSCPEHTLKESLTWMVTLEKKFKETTIFETRFDFDYAGYRRLLNSSKWDTNDRLLDIAQRLLSRF